jgi:dTDP-4-dehydrorhamnose 3,5-epimerase
MGWEIYHSNSKCQRGITAMIFKETRLKGAFEIELEKMEDQRGFFARTFCKNEFETQGLETGIAQCNVSYNKHKGTLRGMHYQVHPHEEAKLVSCITGAAFDVIVDLRRKSPTFMEWLGVELDAKTSKVLYIPEGFAHGFETLRDDTVVCYKMFEFYHPECAQGIRWDDPAFGIDWPLVPEIISKKDQSYKDFEI